MKRTLIFSLTVLMIVFANCSKDKEQGPDTPTLTIEKDVYEYLNTDKSGKFAVAFTGNIEWTVETLEEQAWFSAVKKGDQVEITMDENESLYQRVAKIKIRSSDKSLSKIVVIKQHGDTPTIIVDNAAFKFQNAGDNATVEINSNMTWSLSSASEWLTWEITGNKVKLIATANPEPGERTGVITINAESPIFDKTITISQKGTVDFEIDKKNIQFSREGSTEVIQIETNQEWTYEVSENTTWFTVQRDGSKLSVVARKNSFIDLNGSITITYGFIKVVVQVKQTGIAIGTELDKQVLIAIYESMGGANWNGSRWNINAPLQENTAANDWSGITVAKVNGVDRVTRIALGARGLNGPIPAAIGYLSELISIDFNNNDQKIGGILPASIGNLRKLNSLVLSRSGITGPIPPEIGNLTLLNILQIHTANFSGPIPADVFGKLTVLNSLEIKGNQLTGDLPADMVNNPKFGSWNAVANICPQQTGFGFTNCP